MVYQAIWMKYVFNLASLGSIQTRQTLFVSHVRASEINSVEVSQKFHWGGGKTSVCKIKALNQL